MLTNASRTLFGETAWLAAHPNQVPDGFIAAGLQGTQTLTQALVDDLAAAVVFDPTKSLSIDLWVGRRGDNNNAVEDLLIQMVGTSGTVYFQTRISSSEIDIENGGFFLQNNIVLTPTQTSGPASDIGEQISLRFASGETGGQQVFVDDISNVMFVDAPAPIIPVLKIDRNTGNISLANDTISDFNFIQYSIGSNAGALNTANWTTITGNTDSNGDGTTDADDAWIKLASDGQPNELAEGTLGTSTLAAGQSIDLGNAWAQSPTEDLTVTFQLEDGSFQEVAVNFAGDEIQSGDLDFDGDIDAADWAIQKANNGADLSSIEGVLSYAYGDLNGDNTNDIADFGLFKEAYDAANGEGAFAIMSVPEPTSVALLALSGLAMLRRKNS